MRLWKIKFLCLILLFSMQTTVLNSYESLVKCNVITQENQILSKDIIIRKYRIYNGKRQYRRWNDTKKCWVDSKWLYIS